MGSNNYYFSLINQASKKFGQKIGFFMYFQKGYKILRGGFFSLG